MGTHPSLKTYRYDEPTVAHRVDALSLFAASACLPIASDNARAIYRLP